MDLLSPKSDVYQRVPDENSCGQFEKRTMGAKTRAVFVGKFFLAKQNGTQCVLLAQGSFTRELFPSPEKSDGSTAIKLDVGHGDGSLVKKTTLNSPRGS